MDSERDRNEEKESRNQHERQREKASREVEGDRLLLAQGKILGTIGRGEGAEGDRHLLLPPVYTC